MNENTYRLNTLRIINLWFFPTLMFILCLFAFFSKFNSLHDARVIDIVGLTFLLVFSVGIFVFLFFNHLPIARHTKLIVKSKQITIIQGEKEAVIDFDSITKIEEYTANRLPWGRIVKWCISSNGKIYTISSLTISQLNFERHFHNKTDSKTNLFPMV